ncbi:MAG: hypothetical protein LBU90_09175 [Bacteroidales bacterium]|nr:hypothetical protein [Bacteroidales bacterium]
MQNHYNIVDTENGYSFTTDFGAVYQLTFLFYPLVNARADYNMYMFNIELLKKGKTNTDEKIRLTIEYVLQTFFSENNNAIVIILDSFDNRQFVRKRLFEKWFLQTPNNTIEKIETICHIDDIQLITMLLVEKHNPLRNIIKDDYFDLVKINFYS